METGEATAHFVGDTGYDPSMFTSIRARLGAPDLAMIPIGAYEPRWFMATHHCNPEEAVRIHYELGSRLSIAMHRALFNSPTKPAMRRHRRWPPRSCIQTHRQAFFASSCRVKAP